MTTDSLIEKLARLLAKQPAGNPPEQPDDCPTQFAKMYADRKWMQHHCTDHRITFECGWERGREYERATKRESGELTQADRQQLVTLMAARAEAMGDISMTRNMGNALSAILSDPRFELRRRS